MIYGVKTGCACDVLSEAIMSYILLISITTLATSKHAATYLRRPRERSKLRDYSDLIPKNGKI